MPSENGDNQSLQDALTMDESKGGGDPQKLEEMKKEHEEALSNMAIQMDTELAKMKKECEQKVNEARQEIEYTGANNEADEDKLALLLNNGTKVLQIKNLRKANDRKDKEIEGLKAEKLSLQTEVEKFEKTNEELFIQNEELNEQNHKLLSDLAGKNTVDLDDSKMQLQEL